MNYILTEKYEFENYEKINIENTLILLHNFSYVSLDIEAGGLNEHSDILLIGLHYNGTTIIIMPDMIDKVKSVINKLEHKLLLGSNIKYDLNLLFCTYGFIPTKVYDTEIADRRIYQGLQISVKTPQGLYFSLNHQIKRHLPNEERLTGKDIRLDFINKTKISYKPELIHLDYLKDDLKYLDKIRQKQLVLLKRFNKEDFVLNVSMPLVIVLSQMEMEGIYLNTDKWKENIKNNETKRYDCEVKLDNIRTTLLEQNRLPNLYPLISQGKFSRKRVFKTETVNDNINLFGETLTLKKVKDNSLYVSYKSSLDTVLICAVLGIALPTKEGNYLIPLLIGNKVSAYGIFTKDLSKIKDIQIYKKETELLNYLDDNLINYIPTAGFVLDAKALQVMLKSRKNKIGKEFIETLMLFSEYNTKITNYGLNYLDKISPITGKLHTVYRQTTAVNGRLQSGGGKAKEKDKFNSQNLPRDNAYRTSFYYPDNYLITCDLTGAEVVVMADKANDTTLMALNDSGDIHSPVAQACWRNIFLYRALFEAGYIHEPSEFELHKSKADTLIFQDKTNYEKSKNFVISKKENVQLRNDFKSITFGAVYGAYPKKIAQVLNITENEAIIVLETIKNIFNLTFQYIEQLLKDVFGIRYKDNIIKEGAGMVVFNDRSNNSIFIPPLFFEKKNKIVPDWRDINEWKNVVRNITISGTQADMLKEAMVKLYFFIKTRNIDAAILMQIHDELVVRVNKKVIDEKQTFMYNGELLTFDVIVKNIMVDCANRYLKHIKMGAEYVLAETWIK
jgi:DNA polymerase I-like protein with 3'-5' exonuclease and polymerase domains